MSNDDFEKRLRRIERALNADGSNGPPVRIVHIDGGLPREPCYAEAGALTWTRQPEESLDGFAKRCARDAREHGEYNVVIGGLAGPVPESLEEFLASLHFDDVPQVTDPYGRSDRRAESEE